MTQNTCNPRKEINTWLRQGLISNRQHELMLRICSGDQSEAAAAIAGDEEGSSLLQLFINYEREREFLFQELLITRRKLEWNRKALREALTNLRMARDLAWKTTLIIGRIASPIGGKRSQATNS